MKTPTIDPIFQKSYFDLDAQEKENMRDLFQTEEEFNQMKSFFTNLEKMQNQNDQFEVPSSRIKESLNQTFQATYATKNKSISTFFIAENKNWYQQNLVKIAAALVLIFALVKLTQDPFTSENKQIASNENKESVKKAVPKTEETEANKNAAPITTKDKTQIEFPAEAQALESGKMPIIEELNSPLPIESLETNTNKGASIHEIASSDEQDAAISTSKILTQAKSAHPDGVFKEENNYASAERADVKSTTSFSLKNNKKMLDLLTTCY